MTKLVWDNVGDRRYEIGIDRGVLFLPNGSGVPWNGLTSVTEARTREVKSYYLDGVKYLDRHIPGSYAAKLAAFTYPDELEMLLGNPEFAPGVVVHDQRAKYFNLCYRTLVANDLEDTDHGYKIHVVYNVTASLNDNAMETISQDLSPKPFEWNLTGTPTVMFGLRPTSHISVDSRHLAPALLTLLEETLYGTDGEVGTPPTPPILPTPPTLPGMIELLTMLGANP